MDHLYLTISSLGNVICLAKFFGAPILMFFGITLFKDLLCKRLCCILTGVMFLCICSLLVGYHYMEGPLTINFGSLVSSKNLTFVSFLSISFVLATRMSNEFMLLVKPYRSLFLVGLFIYTIFRVAVYLFGTLAMYPLLLVFALLITLEPYTKISGKMKLNEPLFRNAALAALVSVEVLQFVDLHAPELGASAHLVWLLVGMAALSTILRDSYERTQSDKKKDAMCATNSCSSNTVSKSEENTNPLRKDANVFNEVFENCEALEACDAAYLETVDRAIDKLMGKTSHGEVQDLCDELAVSRSHLHRKMKALLGISISQYMRYYKVKKAVLMLSYEQCSVKEVAFSCGFNSVSYFTRIFTEMIGCPPSRFSEEMVEAVTAA